MQQFHSPQTGVYYLVLTEVEWYAATEQQREAWQVECEREAKARDAKHATLFVDPDAVLSISPIARRHKVWGAQLGPDRLTQFRGELTTLLHEYRDCDRQALQEVLRLYAVP